MARSVIVLRNDDPEAIGTPIRLDDLRSPATTTGLQLWEKLRGDRPFPARADLAPRCFASVLRNIALVKVLDGGLDYEYRVAGDAHVEAQGFSVLGKRVSEIDQVSPGYGTVLKRLYDRVRERGAPLALRGWLQRGDPPQQSVHHESLLLPLGTDTVDHLLIISTYALKAEPTRKGEQKAGAKEPERDPT